MSIFRRKPQPDLQVEITIIAPGEVVTDPDRAEQLGLTADARRMRFEQTKADIDALPETEEP